MVLKISRKQHMAESRIGTASKKGGFGLLQSMYRGV